MSIKNEVATILGSFQSGSGNTAELVEKYVFETSEQLNIFGLGDYVIPEPVQKAKFIQLLHNEVKIMPGDKAKETLAALSQGFLGIKHQKYGTGDTSKTKEVTGTAKSVLTASQYKQNCVSIRVTDTHLDAAVDLLANITKALADTKATKTDLSTILAAVQDFLMSNKECEQFAHMMRQEEQYRSILIKLESIGFDNIERKIDGTFSGTIPVEKVQVACTELDSLGYKTLSSDFNLAKMQVVVVFAEGKNEPLN